MTDQHKLPLKLKKKKIKFASFKKKPKWQEVQKVHIICYGEMGESPVLDHTQRPADLYL